MRKKNIETRKVYPFPIHTMKAYKNYFSNRKNLKNSEIKSKGIFCLPLYPELSEKKIMLICKNLKKILHKIKK